MTIAEEKALLEKVLSEDKQSYDGFIRKYTKLIYNSIYRTLELKGYKIAPDLAEDLHQEVFLSLIDGNFRKLRTFKWERNCSLATWLGVVTRNFVLNFIRTDSKYKSLTKSIDEEIDEEKENSLKDIIKDKSLSIREKMDRDAVVDIMNKRVEKLDITERAILEMFYLQDLPLKEIARVLGKSEDAVFMQKKRLVAQLQEKIKKDVGF